MSVDTLSFSDTQKVKSPTNDGNHDRFQHYFRKSEIDENLMTGKEMTALCGKKVKSQIDPKGLTICHQCQTLMDEVVGSNL